jgi:AcrR family transcriptional regulator
MTHLGLASRSAMQAITCMHRLQRLGQRGTSSASSRPAWDPEATRRRILDAAEAVFSRDGLRGGTTREIAREAGVNEVTVFRHFRSRDLLLAAVMARGALSTADELRSMAPWSADLRASMLAYARILSQKFLRHEALCRAYVAEANLLAGSTRRAIAKSSNFTRAHAAEQIRAAQKAGVVRTDLDPRLVADVLTDALIIGTLRRSSPRAGGYSTDTLLAGTIAILVRGIEVPQPGKSARVRGK